VGLLSVSQLKDPICFAGTTGKSAPPICRLHRLTAPKFSKKIHEFSKKKKLKFADLSRLGAPTKHHPQWCAHSQARRRDATAPAVTPPAHASRAS
jgi:hypothetical protein